VTSSDIITVFVPRRARLSRKVARMRKMRNSYMLHRTPEGKRSFRRPWLMFEDNIKMGVKQVQDRL
jgi:hypothetical protein